MAPSDMTPASGGEQHCQFIVAEPFNASAEQLGVGKVLRLPPTWRDHACCVSVMHSRDVEQRPEWTQKVVNALVKSAIADAGHRVQTAALMSASGETNTPHLEPVLQKYSRRTAKIGRL